MKLTYRGISYEMAPAQVTDSKFHAAQVRQDAKAKTQSLNAILRYRGATYEAQPAVNHQSIPTGVTLKYRGVAYAAAPEVEAQVETKASTAVQPVATISVEERARELVQNHHRVTKQRQQVILNRNAHEAGINTDLSGYWNHIQGKVNPSFWATYDRSHVALS
jgi:hypothetical protein